MWSGIDSAELPADAIELGRILEAWGIKGWFKVLPYSAEPEALFSSKRWFLLSGPKGPKAFEGARLLKIKEAKWHTDILVASAHGVDDRSQADGLQGARIFVAKSSFPTLDPNEYYWVDLIGLTVTNRQGVVLGKVTDLLATGPQTVLVLEDAVAGKPVQRMIPFVSAYVDAVDLTARHIAVDWQPDY